jgi:hypothetical protein
MQQKIESPSTQDLMQLEYQRDWVKGHYAGDDPDFYALPAGKLDLIAAILQAGFIAPEETWKLQSLGVVLGDAMAQELGFDWVTVEDEYGRDPALQDPLSTLILFPLTTISKRVEQGEVVDVHQLFATACRDVLQRRPAYPVSTTH